MRRIVVLVHLFAAAFKTYQKFVALSLMLVVISGVWSGLSSPAWRRKTLTATTVGLAVFLLLAFS